MNLYLRRPAAWGQARPSKTRLSKAPKLSQSSPSWAGGASEGWTRPKEDVEPRRMRVMRRLRGGLRRTKGQFAPRERARIAPGTAISHKILSVVCEKVPTHTKIIWLRYMAGEVVLT